MTGSISHNRSTALFNVLHWKLCVGLYYNPVHSFLCCCVWDSKSKESTPMILTSYLTYWCDFTLCTWDSCVHVSTPTSLFPNPLSISVREFCFHFINLETCKPRAKLWQNKTSGVFVCWRFASAGVKVKKIRFWRGSRGIWVLF